MVYVLHRSYEEVFAMGNMRKIELLIFMSALGLLTGNFLMMTPAVSLLGAVVALLAMMAMLGLIAVYTGMDSKLSQAE